MNSVGLSTREALHRLHNDIAMELKSLEQKKMVDEKKFLHPGTWKWDAYHHDSPYSTFKWTSGVMLLLEALFLFICYGSSDDPRFSRLILDVLIILLILMCNVCIVGWDSKLKHRELQTRIKELLILIEDCMHKCELSAIQYSTLNIPLSPCITLQWTYRDGNVVNLHWSLLVQGDVICLRPGQLSPARCCSFDKSGEKEELQFGEQYVPKPTETQKKSFKYPRARKPLKAQNFLVLETPYIKNLRLALKNSRLRPLTIFDSERHLITSQWMTKFVIPAVIILMLCINTFRYIYLSSSVGSWQEMLILLQVQAVLPLLPLLFPLMWLFLNTHGNAYLHTLFQISKEVKVKVEPFDEFGEMLPTLTKCNLTWQILYEQFVNILQGKDQFPTRSTNLLHVLGSVTALCCIDKKGLLSWPNPTAEKVFFLRSPSFSPDSSKLSSDFQSVESLMKECNVVEDKDEQLTPESFQSDIKAKSKIFQREQSFKTESVVEVLDLTHDSQIAFGLQFDDLKWKKYINSLKPLGLAILLNTCNPATQDNYTQFSAHIAYEALENEDVVPVVNRREVGQSAEYPHSHSRCLCELARQIGFSDQAMDVFQLQEQLSTFRPVQPNMGRKDRFAKSLSFTKLKFPFPHMVSVIMKECSSGMSQLLSQGTGDIILDSCSEYWDGTDIHPLTESDRKKILDFYHRTSLTAYCTAFAYRPMTSLVSTEFNLIYLELPANSSRLYPSIRSPTPTISWDLQSLDTHMKCSLTHYFSTDSILGNERQQEPIADVDGCFAAQCNQIFIGMVTMQYQARVDIVHLIEQLDKACIRFVHFSKENELRSRVFSEKMGLESGWNCHISLLCDCSSKTDKSNILVGEDNAIDGRSRRSSDFNMWKTTGDCLQPFPQARYSVDRSLHRSCSAPSAINVDVATVKFEDEISMYDVSASEVGSVTSIHSAHRTKLDISVGNKYIEADAISDDTDMKEDPLAPLCQSFQADELNTSRSPSHITESTDQSAPVAFDMSNRAKLPKGIENIRPHLENIDNVPLLVSLFTDCTPHATQEMIKIMQENGEVVCCMGSAANCHNMAIFLQADASVAIEPLYPELCMKQSVFTSPLTKEGSLMVHISHQLNSLTSSLSFYREEPVSIYSLIMQSRHIMSCMRNCFQFMLMCCLSLMSLQLLNCLVLLPPMLTTSHVLWISCVTVPLISLSLTKSPVDPQITTHSTGKNKTTIDRTAVFQFIAFTGMKFIPSIIICIVCFGLMLYDFCISLTLDTASCHLVYGNMKFTRSHEWNGWINNCKSKFIFAQNLTAFFLVFYFACISASFVHKFYQLWIKVPFENKTWCIIVITVILLQLLYGVIDVLIQKASTESIADIVHIPLSTCVIAFIWPVVLITFNESIKRYEIRSNVRNQKRARLEFGTKLGMNSPF